MPIITSFELIVKLERWLLCLVIAAILIYGTNAAICKIFSIPPDWIVLSVKAFSHQ